MSATLHPSCTPHCRLSHWTSLWAGQLSPTMLSAPAQQSAQRPETTVPDTDPAHCTSLWAGLLLSQLQICRRAAVGSRPADTEDMIIPKGGQLSPNTVPTAEQLFGRYVKYDKNGE
ncbi:hypothetical protein ABVT39_017389 [Epinephelus coioides]